MQKKNVISNNQIKNLLVTTIIGVGILSLPSNIAVVLDNDGWIAVLVSGLLIIPFILIIDKLFKMYPNKTIFEIGEEVLGKFIFKIFLIIIAIYATITLAYSIRVFGEVIKAYLLERTPIAVIIITMLLATSYVSRAEIEILGRVATMVYPVLLALFIFLFLINMPKSDYTDILPLFNADFTKLPRGIMVTIFSYAGYEIIMLAYPLTDNRKDTLKYALRGLFIVIGIYLAAFFISLSQLGVNQLKRTLWPTIAIAKEVDLPGYFLENLDGIVIALWVLIVYTSVGPLFYIGGKTLSYIFNIKSHDVFILPLIPIIYLISMIPDNIISVYDEMGRILSYFLIASIMAVPAIIFFAALIKRRRRRT